MLTWWCLCHICREELKKESRRLLKELKGSKKESAKEETEKKNSGQCKLHVTRHLDFIAQARFLFAPIGTDMFAVVASDEESAEESNELVADFKAQRKKYEKKQKFIGKKGSDRETATLDMLAKFQVRKNDVVRHIFFQELSASHWNRASEILPLQHSMRRPPCYVTLSIDVQNVWHVLACDCTSKKYRTALAQCVWCGVVLLCLQLSGTRPKVTNRPSRRDTTSSAFWCHVTMCSGHSCAAFAVGNLWDLEPHLYPLRAEIYLTKSHNFEGYTVEAEQIDPRSFCNGFVKRELMGNFGGSSCSLRCRPR